jgi:hypothetical protein
MLVVTSVYNASYQDVLNFTRAYGLDLLVYNKNDSLKLGEEVVTLQQDKLKVIDIPNYGRCDYAFLYYIVKNYNSLPDKVLFTKANFRYEDIQLHHLLRNADFINAGVVIKYGVLNKDFDTSILTSKGVELVNIEAPLYVNRRNFSKHEFHTYYLGDLYEIVYGNRPIPDDYVVNFGHGPCFSVTKDLITSHPVEIYDKLLDVFYPGKGHWPKWEGHSEEETMVEVGKRYHDQFQRFWMILFVQNYKTERVDTDLRYYVSCTG